MGRKIILSGLEISNTHSFLMSCGKMCVGNRYKEPEQPTSDKEFAIWENKNSKAYALIAASINEEVSRHISQFSNTFETLQKLKELYDSHSTLEVVQLMIKLFTLELKNDDLLSLASEVKSIMHDIKVTNVELDILLIAFLKALYPTYSNYLESLQANGNLKGITFDSLVKKIAEREKAFGKKITPQYFEEVVCLAHREKNLDQDSSRGKGGRRGRGRNFRGRGAHTLKEKSQICTAYAAKEMDHMMHPHESCLGTELNMKETNAKVKLMTKRKVKHLNPLTMLWHTIILE